MATKAQFEKAFKEFMDKTDWVQGDKRFEFLLPWGKHRADIMKAYIEHLEKRAEAAEHERDCHMDIAEHFKSRCKDLELRKGISCHHQWNNLKLVECGGNYQYCTLCGAKKVAE